MSTSDYIWLGIGALVVAYIAFRALRGAREERSDLYFYYRFGRRPRRSERGLTLEEAQLPVPDDEPVSAGDAPSGTALASDLEDERRRARGDDLALDVAVLSTFYPRSEPREPHVFDEPDAPFGAEDPLDEIDDWPID